MKLFNSFRLKERREAFQMLIKLANANGKILVIHYSCESFYGKQGITPRVTSIAVLNRENNESKIFSMHLSAQILNKDIMNVDEKEYNLIEKEMLEEFSKFVLNHNNYYWIHWNMRSASYGFQAISNRNRILGGNEIVVSDTNKIDLSNLFGKLYTFSFEKDKPNGQMLNLASRNNISLRDALPGKDEADAFEKKEFLKLHMSTMRKVEIIDRLFMEYEKNNLKHNARLKEIYGLTIPGIFHLVKESPILIGIWSIAVFIIGAAFEPIIQHVFGTAK